MKITQKKGTLEKRISQFVIPKFRDTLLVPKITKSCIRNSFFHNLHCQGHPNVLQWLQEIQPGFQQRLLGEKCSGYRKWYRGNWRIWGVTSGSHHFRCRGGKQKDPGLFHPLRWVLNLVKKCQQWQEDGIIPLVHYNTTKTTSSTRITVVCNSKRPKSLKQSLKLRTSSRTNVLL